MSEKRYAVGVDAGFASTVGVVFEFDPTKREGDLVGVATRLSVPRVIPSRVMQGANQSASLLGENLRNSYKVDGLTFTVDSELPNESTRNPTLYHYSPTQCVLNQHILQELQLSDKKNLTLVTGLPINLYYQNNGVNSENVQRKINKLLSTTVEPLYDENPIVLKDVDVKAEGVGAYFDLILNEQGILDRSNESKRVAIVDIGGETIDITEISKVSVINHNRTASANIGVLDVLKEIQKGLAELGINETLEYRLEKMLHTRRYTYKNKELEPEKVYEILGRAIRTVFFRVENFVTQTLGDANDIDEILICGGGGMVFGEELKEIYEQARIVENPQFANANGFAKFALFKLRQAYTR